MRRAGDVDIEAVELCCWKESASEVEKPDSVGMRVLSAMILLEEKETQARYGTCTIPMADMTDSGPIELTMYVPGSRAYVCNFGILDFRKKNTGVE